MSSELETEKILSQEGSIELLEEIRDLLKKRLTVKDYEDAESKTDETDFRKATLKNIRDAAYLHGFVNGSYMLADVVGRLDDTTQVLGIVRVNEVRDIALKMVMMAIKQSIENFSGGDA